MCYFMNEIVKETIGGLRSDIEHGNTVSIKSPYLGQLLLTQHLRNCSVLNFCTLGKCALL